MPIIVKQRYSSKTIAHNQETLRSFTSSDNSRNPFIPQGDKDSRSFTNAAVGVNDEYVMIILLQSKPIPDRREVRTTPQAPVILNKTTDRESL